LEPWYGREAADITYADSEGVFTALLIATGFLDDSWTGAKPNYFLEVKSTTSQCETPFYVSKAQYDRVRSSQSWTLFYPTHPCPRTNLTGLTVFLADRCKLCEM
jgi:hypothetical protein